MTTWIYLLDLVKNNPKKSVLYGDDIRILLIGCHLGLHLMTDRFCHLMF